MRNKNTKKKFITILIITNILTFILSNFISLRLNPISLVSGEFNEKYSRYSKVAEIEKYIKNNYLRDVNDEDLLSGQLKGLVASLEDPYSAYLTEEEFNSLLEQTSGSFGGIGVVVTPGEDNLITVVSPVEDTPGERAGIITGDKIVRVNGKEFTSETMDEAVKEMKGEPGTEVKIDIVRKTDESNVEELKLNIKREEIRVKTVKSNRLEEDIGYISLSSFDEKTYIDFKKELDIFSESGIKGLILDLRNNPGGLLNVAAEITDEFLGEGDIVYTETKNGNREYLKSDKGKVEYPLVVLVNEGSASASEILAGAIKDRDRGKIIGMKTFGKGVVQVLQDLPDGSGLKLTVSEYFTPKGINIHGIGIEPNVKVENEGGFTNIGPENLEDDMQLKKAIEVLKKDIRTKK